MLRAVGLSRSFGEEEGLVWAVDRVDLDVPTGQTLAVTGPSGCGKSTLLQLLGGLDRPTEGEVWLGGRRVDGLGERALARLRRRTVGFVFQAYHLMDELTALENVETAALLAGASPRAARRRAAELLGLVGLGDRARHLPSELSGGQRQRAAIARALVNDPLVVLADEPTGDLDSAATRDVLRLFGELRAAGRTLVVVTHDERVAATADRVVAMRDGALADEVRLHGYAVEGARGASGAGTGDSALPHTPRGGGDDADHGWRSGSLDAGTGDSTLPHTPRGGGDDAGDGWGSGGFRDDGSGGAGGGGGGSRLGRLLRWEE